MEGLVLSHSEEVSKDQNKEQSICISQENWSTDGPKNHWERSNNLIQLQVIFRKWSAKE